MKKNQKKLKLAKSRLVLQNGLFQTGRGVLRDVWRAIPELKSANKQGRRAAETSKICRFCRIPKIAKTRGRPIKNGNVDDAATADEAVRRRSRAGNSPIGGLARGPRVQNRAAAANSAVQCVAEADAAAADANRSARRLVTFKAVQFRRR